VKGLASPLQVSQAKGRREAEEKELRGVHNPSTRGPVGCRKERHCSSVTDGDGEEAKSTKGKGSRNPVWGGECPP